MMPKGVGLTLLLALATVAETAPAPKPRQTPFPLVIQGVWHLQWYGCAGWVRLLKNGRYECGLGQARYWGWYTWDGSTLTVWESAEKEGPFHYRWQVQQRCCTLEGDRIFLRRD